MDFTSMMGKAQSFAGPASDTIVRLLDEFNAALPVMEALGFSVQDIHVSMGILPEISARLTAAVASVDVKAIDTLIARNSEQKTLVAALKALQTAYNVRGQLGDLGLKGIELNVTLGLPPKIGIGFLKSPAMPPSPVPAAST
jgi:hypothetical protein